MLMVMVYLMTDCTSAVVLSAVIENEAAGDGVDVGAELLVAVLAAVAAAVTRGVVLAGVLGARDAVTGGADGATTAVAGGAAGAVVTAVLAVAVVLLVAVAGGTEGVAGDAAAWELDPATIATTRARNAQARTAIVCIEYPQVRRCINQVSSRTLHTLKASCPTGFGKSPVRQFSCGAAAPQKPYGRGAS